MNVEWEQRGGKRRVKCVRLYVSAYRALTEGDVTVKLTDREADALVSGYLKQLQDKEG
jgi:hypothetical protein